MGKKKRKQRKISPVGKPFVSVCTPTYNRRVFIPNLIRCYQSQDYPKQLMEWIVIDDGEDSVEDLFKDVEGVKYFRVDIAKSPEAKKKYRIRMAPTIIVFNKGIKEDSWKAGLDLECPVDLEELQEAIEEVKTADKF